MKDDSTYAAGLLNPEYIRHKQKEGITLNLLRDWSKTGRTVSLKIELKKEE